MSTYIHVKGKPTIKGFVSLSGSKNASLPIIITCLLSEKPLHLKNVPNLKDIQNLIEILQEIGVSAEFNKEKHFLTLHRNKTVNTTMLEDSSKTLRASVLVLGPLLAKFGSAVLSSPGGCSIGSRPIDLHIFGLEKLGAIISYDDSVIKATAKDGLIGNDIDLSFPSVGATENLIMAASLAKGTTRISNYAHEPEIMDLISCLNGMGAKITINDEKIIIEGVSSLNEHTHEIIPDRIELGSYILAGSINQGELVIKNANLSMLQTEVSIFRQIGIEISEENNQIFVKGPKTFKAINIETSVYPGFSTDLQSQLFTVLCTADGVSTVKETIFENRFLIVSELVKLNCEIETEGRIAIIKGVPAIKGNKLKSCSDLRGTFSLIMAGMLSEGETLIYNYDSINRGYENWLEKLQSIGVDVKIMEEKP
jgi:UDP-N-acetylglucosamine 1-carboxyvinyltransferase